jgi:hypothetical protein
MLDRNPNIERPDDMPDDPGHEGIDDPIPLPPIEDPPAPVEEPPDSPHTPDEPNPLPTGDPIPNEPTRLV